MAICEHVALVKILIVGVKRSTVSVQCVVRVVPYVDFEPDICHVVIQEEPHGFDVDRLSKFDAEPLSRTIGAVVPIVSICIVIIN